MAKKTKKVEVEEPQIQEEVQVVEQPKVRERVKPKNEWEIKDRLYILRGSKKPLSKVCHTNFPLCTKLNTKFSHSYSKLSSPSIIIIGILIENDIKNKKTPVNI